MSAEYGRKVEVTWDGDPILGVREKSLSVNGEPVNVTSDENDGRRHLLDEDEETSVDVELSGVTKDTVFRDAKINGTIVGELVMTYANGDTLTLPARLGAYSEGQPYNEAITFTQNVMSSGDWTYVKGTP